MIDTKQPVQLWNGLQFSYHTESEAKQLVKAGTHQRTRGVDANKLHGPGHFRTAALIAEDLKEPAKKQTGKKPPNRRTRHGKYNTTQLKAE